MRILARWPGRILWSYARRHRAVRSLLGLLRGLAWRRPMLDILAIAVGAAVGANLRYGLALWAARRWGTTFPYGTMLINILGCLLIGFILVLATGRPAVGVIWQRLLVTGLLGGFTTFSTFGYETYALLIGGSW